MLELRRSLAISSYRSPVVWPGDVLVGACVDHGLDGKYVTWFHEARSFVIGVVRHIGCHVELLADSMAAVSLINCQTKLTTIYPFSSMYLVITLPTSRYMVPGLQISNAFCRHSYDLVTRNLLDSETSPTKYVSFRSM